jgi:uncharacterized protein DUF3473
VNARSQGFCKGGSRTNASSDPFPTARSAPTAALADVWEAGFAYDSSINPGLHDRYRWLSAPRRPVRLEGTELVVFPVPLLSHALPIAFSGGAYLRLLPQVVVNWGLRRSRAEAPEMVYLHPWELDPYSRSAHGTFRQSLTGRIGRNKFARVWSS